MVVLLKKSPFCTMAFPWDKAITVEPVKPSPHHPISGWSLKPHLCQHINIHIGIMLGYSSHPTSCIWRCASAETRSIMCVPVAVELRKQGMQAAWLIV